jgi:chemotaxis protein methyltransferase CheR
VTDDQAMDTVVDRVAELLHERIGLRADASLRGRLRRAVRDEATRHGRELMTYVDTLVPGTDALQDLVNRVTVQETAFFRHPHQFDVLARDVLSVLSRPVTIWSAGCANGQEAYSVAMLLEEQGIEGRVIATDLSTAALRRTRAARYTSRELTGLSPARVAAHLTRSADTWQVNQPVRDRVSTLRHNLLDPLPPEVLGCQVVLCRNVIIYFSPEHARAFLDRVADALGSTGYLFLGAAETIWQVSDRFKAIAVGDTYIYRQPVRQPRSTPHPRPAPLTAQPEPRRSRPTVDIAPAAGTVSDEAAGLSERGQNAIAAHDYDAAVVAFRKCAYLAPHDPMAQLHLGLALQASGDEPSAQRAFAAARRLLLETDPALGVAGIEGIARAELIRLLDSKQRVLAR